MGTGFFRLVGSPWSLVQPIFWLVVGMVFISIFVVDLLYMLIPFWMNLFLFSFVMAYKLLLLSFGMLRGDDFLRAILSGLVLALVLQIISKLTKKIKGVEGFGVHNLNLSEPFSFFACL